MRLILVRHGEPNYQLDCLTEFGRRQAEAAALLHSALVDFESCNEKMAAALAAAKEAN